MNASSALRSPPRQKTEVLLLFVAFIWAANFPISKWGIAGLDIFIFNAVRFFVAFTIVAVFFATRFTWTPIEPADRRRLLWIGFVANVVYQMAFIVGLSLTTAGNAAILLATSPLWTVFLNARLHKEPISAAMWLGMAVSLIGVVMIIIGSGKKLELGSTALIGDVVMLTAAALWGLNTNLQKPLVARYSAVQVTLVMLAIGAVGLTVAAVPSAIATPFLDVHWSFYLAAAISGAFSIGIANVIWSIGVKRLGPSRTGNFHNLVPVLAFTISYFTLDEQVLPIQIAGAAVTVVGVWVARR